MSIQISKEEYFQLKKDSLKLGYLESGGVDNWECYSESLNPEGEIKFREAVEELKKDIFSEKQID